MKKGYILLFNNQVTAAYSLDEFLGSPSIFSGFTQADISRDCAFVFEGNHLKMAVKKSEKLMVSINGKPVGDSESMLIHNDLISFKMGSCICYMLFIDEMSVMRSTTIKMQNGVSLCIGQSEKNNIVISHPAVLEQHAEISMSNGHIRLIAAKNSYTYVNSQLCKSTSLNMGDYVQILSCRIYILGTCIMVIGEFQTQGVATATVIEHPVIEKDRFSPVPRIYRSLEKVKIVIDPPPAMHQSKPVPFILAAGPSLTMALAMAVSTAIGIGNAVTNGVSGTFITSILMAISMLAGALLWPWLLRRYNEEQEQRLQRLRATKYTTYLKQKEDEINRVYTKNCDILHKYKYPPVETLTEVFYGGKIAHFLWERGSNDDDFLSVRLGYGSYASDISIQVPEKRFSLDEDPLTNEVQKLAEKYERYQNVPICFSLIEQNIVGVFGKTENVDSIICNIVAYILILHSADNVKTAFLFPGKAEAAKYAYLADIPHIWNRDKTRKFFSYSENDTESLLAHIYNQIMMTCSSSAHAQTEHYVIFVWDRGVVERSTLYKLCLEKEDGCAFSFVFIAQSFGELPKECKAVIQCGREHNGIYVKNRNDNHLVPFTPDSCDIQKLRATIRKISGYYNDDFSIDPHMPLRIGFLDMFRVGNIAELAIEHRWKNSMSHMSLATPIGIGESGEILHFDIHEAFHGCHGIVAGTTGSGKSEFLQSYILSMMINYSPEDINFVLVDFKGGDIATPFLGLPHLCAVISNLSKSVLYRAMVSLEAEQIRRQKLFEAKKEELNIDKIDINSYQKFYHSGVIQDPLPHLIIIMDEFAQFKNQHSEYMQKLINIAQIGRSLGIHLILATQKPAGVVDGQIWSNSRFKMCLKVLEREDSKAVLQRDEAAYIKTPGTGYLQVGFNEIFTKFQSGYSRTKYIPQQTYYNMEDLTVQMIDSTGNVLEEEVDINLELKAEATTQISAITEEIRSISRSLGLYAKPLWLSELPAFVYVQDCINVPETTGITLQIGLMDIPVEQSQIWYIHNFVTDGSIALYGASGTGKTTCVQSMLYQAVCKYTAREFQYAIVDMSARSYAMFADTAYDFGSVLGGAPEQIDELFDMLEQELAYRKEILAEENCNSYAEFLHLSSKQMPGIVVILENYAKFREQAYSYEERLIDLVASGQSYGVYFIVTTNSKAGIYHKVREQLPRVITFGMLDADSYRDLLGVRIDTEPENINGRALVIHNHRAVEMQAALPIRSESENVRLQKMKERLQREKNEKREQDPRKAQQSFQFKPSYNVKNASHSVWANIPTYISVGQTGKTVSVGFDAQKHSEVFVDLEQHKKVFVCSDVIQDFSEITEKMLSMASECEVWFITGSENESLSATLNEIAACIESARLPTVIIPDFKQLYSDISNENLDKLCRFIRNHEKLAFITCSSLQELDIYRDTELFILLCRRSNVTIFAGEYLNDDMAILLNENVSKLEKTFREKHRRSDQCIVCVDSEYSITYFREAGE